MQHLLGLYGEHCEVFPQLAFAQRVLDIFDNVELDVAVAQDFQRAPGLASIGVVVDGHVRHGGLLCGWGFRMTQPSSTRTFRASGDSSACARFEIMVCR